MQNYEAGLQASDRGREAEPLLIAGISQDLFTEQVRFVLRLAQEEARHFQHHSIGTHHLLLGLLGEEEGVGSLVLSSLGVDLQKVRHAVTFIVGHGYGSPAGSFPLTPRAKRVIKLAVTIAQMHQQALSTEHLLLGLVLEGEGMAAGILECLGVSLEKVRRLTLEALNPLDVPDRSAFALQSGCPDECDLEERRTISERIDDILFFLGQAFKFLGGAILSIVALLWALGVVAFSLIVVLLFLIVDAALLLNIRASECNDSDRTLDLEFFWDMTREALEVATSCLVMVPLLAGMILGWLAATLWVSATGIFHLMLLLLDLFSEG